MALFEDDISSNNAILAKMPPKIDTLSTEINGIVSNYSDVNELVMAKQESLAELVDRVQIEQNQLSSITDEITNISSRFQSISDKRTKIEENSKLSVDSLFSSLSFNHHVQSALKTPLKRNFIDSSAKVISHSSTFLPKDSIFSLFYGVKDINSGDVKRCLCVDPNLEWNEKVWAGTPDVSSGVVTISIDLNVSVQTTSFGVRHPSSLRVANINPLSTPEKVVIKDHDTGEVLCEIVYNPEEDLSMCSIEFNNLNENDIISSKAQHKAQGHELRRVSFDFIAQEGAEYVSVFCLQVWGDAM
ncbi:hypothetical protein ADUPG1_013797 [Aduncisulcus paluster]|uniref:SUN domain-containing protein n=1 Tax=Aduncisulcus paluster TaxID=2918883 RepID=A0ABQ5K4Q4_9EUKA|nr:hypothetical protein ADUPG1_013797 [Aduncisulcus paluster]